MAAELEHEATRQSGKIQVHGVRGNVTVEGGVEGEEGMHMCVCVLQSPLKISTRDLTGKGNGETISRYREKGY